MTKRVISKFEEEVIRLCHHDFAGLTQTEAAQRLDVSQGLISETLAHIKKKAPQLFPILTKRQGLVRDYIVDEGLTHQQIAILLLTSEHCIDSTVATMKAKGVCFEKPRKLLRYERWMDKHVRRKL